MNSGDFLLLDCVWLDEWSGLIGTSISMTYGVWDELVMHHLMWDKVVPQTKQALSDYA
jgi:hypothetical protein